MAYYYSSRIKKDLKKKLRLRFMGKKTISFLVVCGIIVVGFMYLVQTNNMAVSGYQMKELDSKIMSLKEDRQNLGIQVTQLESLQNIEKMVDELGMVPVEKVEYLSAKSPVAVAR